MYEFGLCSKNDLTQRRSDNHFVRISIFSFARLAFLAGSVCRGDLPKTHQLRYDDPRPANMKEHLSLQSFYKSV